MKTRRWKMPLQAFGSSTNPHRMAKSWFSPQACSSYGPAPAAKKFVAKWLRFLDFVEEKPDDLVQLIEQRRLQLEDEPEEHVPDERPNLLVCVTEVVSL